MVSTLCLASEEEAVLLRAHLNIPASKSRPGFYYELPQMTKITFLVYIKIYLTLNNGIQCIL